MRSCSASMQAVGQVPELAGSLPRHGLVAIGRNEGERLVRCLASMRGDGAPIVYVDSGSVDGSLCAARAAGAIVVELDASVPFTAARARNAGWRELVRRHPDLELVQFVDGDCELAAGWTRTAVRFLDENPSHAVVFGRRRERHREATAYNRLCDMEWDVPPGLVASCGGDAMVRVRALVDVGGYDDSLIAGEEPDLCFRMRERGWLVECIAAEMTLHDADMHRFGQWWRRSVRWGHVLAEGLARRGAKYPSMRAALSAMTWSAEFPVLAVLLGFLAGPVAALLVVAAWLLGLGAIGFRSFRHARRRGARAGDAGLFAASCVLGKFAQFRGMIGFWLHRASGRQARLIEYKGPEPASGGGVP